MSALMVKGIQALFGADEFNEAFNPPRSKIYFLFAPLGS